MVVPVVRGKTQNPDDPPPQRLECLDDRMTVPCCFWAPAPLIVRSFFFLISTLWRKTPLWTLMVSPLWAWFTACWIDWPKKTSIVLAIPVDGKARVAATPIPAAKRG